MLDQTGYSRLSKRLSTVAVSSTIKQSRYEEKHSLWKRIFSEERAEQFREYSTEGPPARRFETKTQAILNECVSG